MKKFKLNFQAMLISFVAIASIGGSMLAVAAPQTAFAADKCSQSFLGFPTWYRGLTDASCDIQSPNSSGGLSNFI